MQPSGEDHLLQGSSIGRVAVASFVGTAIEWYDFYLYGTTAALVFPRLFFPQLNPLSATLASFATFGVAFVARPLGGVVFGHFGDRAGRKSMLVLTLLLMGLSTFLIGAVPDYDEVGALAPVLLVLLRFLQGIAVGGEWGGATLMVVEHAPDKSRNFYAAWPQLGSPVGLMLSTAVFGAFSSLPDRQFFAWGWRVPFLLSIVLIAVGLFIRLRIMESPVFTRIKQLKIESRVPLAEVLRGHLVAAVLSIGISIAIFVQFYIISTFVPAYATAQLGVPRSVVLAGVLSMGAGLFAGVSIAGMLADRLGKRPVGFAGALGMCLPAFPAFWLIDTRSPVLICLAMGVWMIGGGVLYGVAGALTAELFPARLRYSGISLGLQVAGLIGGAFTPVIATALVSWSGGKSWPVAGYVAASAVLPLAAIWFASEKHRVGIEEVQTAHSGIAMAR
jgi:metabolite-proton symporter